MIKIKWLTRQFNFRFRVGISQGTHQFMCTITVNGLCRAAAVWPPAKIHCLPVLTSVCIMQSLLCVQLKCYGNRHSFHTMQNVFPWERAIDTHVRLIHHCCFLRWRFVVPNTILQCRVRRMDVVKLILICIRIRIAWLSIGKLSLVFTTNEWTQTGCIGRAFTWQ